MEVLQPRREGELYSAFIDTSVQHIPLLPLDIITCTMGFLPQADLWRAAAVSREFYAAAHSAGLEIHRTITLRPSGEQDLATFTDIVDHVSRKTARGDLALSFVCECNGNWHDHDECLPARSSILEAITKSLPLLTRFDVDLCACCCSKFYDALAPPAPRLRTFVFTLWKICDNCDRACALPLPSSLFGGTAPRLADVTLRHAAVDLVGEIVPAFARVRRVSLNSNFRSQPKQLQLTRSFPAVRTLALVVRLGVTPLNRAPLTLVDLSSLALDRLVVIDKTQAAAAFKHLRTDSACPLAVSKFEYVCDAIEYYEPLWPAGKPELNAHIRRGETLQILVTAVSSARKDWSHTIFSEGFFARELTPLIQLPPLHAQLVSLTLEEHFLPHFVRTPQTLAALRELFVDCTVHVQRLPVTDSRLEGFDRLDALFSVGLPVVRMPEDGISNVAFSVPALKTVTTFVRTGKSRVDSCKFAALGRALSQAGVQPPEQRAELVLVGIPLDDAIIGLLRLLQTYRAVRTLCSSERVVPEYCDYRTDDPRNEL